MYMFSLLNESVSQLAKLDFVDQKEKRVFSQAHYFYLLLLLSC